jgi:hypothetical protein
MAHEYWMIEVILWIIAIVLLGFGSLGMYRVYRKDKAKLSLGVTLFFALFIFSRICIMVLIYKFGYQGDIQYLLPYPHLLWLQIGYNFAYVAVFILYFVLERYAIHTVYIFSTITIVLLVLSTANYFIPENLFIYQIPFFIPIILGFPSIYLYLAWKNPGEVRSNSLLLAAGLLIFELGMVLSIPNAQYAIWASFMPSIIYEILGPILHSIGTLIIYIGYARPKK